MSSATTRKLSLTSSRLPVCYPATELSVVRHEPDNRFLECALAVDAEFIVTVNTAPRALQSE
jgi:predicted nucleic acid-binding protein